MARSAASLSVTLLLALSAPALALFACSSGGSAPLGADGGAGDGGSPAQPDGCPAMAPAEGDACSLAADAQCNYGCGNGGPAVAVCSGGRFALTFLDVECAPPAEVVVGADGGCPEARPIGTPPNYTPLLCPMSLSAAGACTYAVPSPDGGAACSASCECDCASSQGGSGSSCVWRCADPICTDGGS